MTFKPPESKNGQPCKRCTRQGKLCYQHKRPRRQLKKGESAYELQEAETLARKQAFLAGFSRIATVTGAVEHAGITRATHYRWLQDDPEYAAAFRGAEEEATDRLEQEARRRAVVGTQEPVYYQGEQVGSIRRYSDTLLIFLLKGRKPEMYRERFSHEHSGPGQGPIEVQPVLDISKLSIETKRRVYKELTAAAAEGGEEDDGGAMEIEKIKAGEGRG